MAKKNSKANAKAVSWDDEEASSDIQAAEAEGADAANVAPSAASEEKAQEAAPKKLRREDVPAKHHKFHKFN